MKSTVISLLFSLSLIACGDAGGGDAGADPATQDADGDGFIAADDCDDSVETGAAVYPGAEEICDGLDNDCDGYVDNGAADSVAWYMDVDLDGYGDDVGAIYACEAPSGYVSQDGDCDDADAAFNPGVAEDCTDPTDYNCDGSVAYADADGDGFPACQDCDDGSADAHPDADERCDGIDNNCDGAIDEDSAVDALVWYGDGDGDGFGDPAVSTLSCAVPVGDGAWVDNAEDCDDADSATSPAVDEICDAIDNNCDGAIDEDSAVDAETWYFDGDGDGWGEAGITTQACAVPENYVSDQSGGTTFDCNDASAEAWPGATEVCDGIDNNCDGDSDESAAVDAATWYVDVDNDGYGDAGRSLPACAQPFGYVSDASDCDDDLYGINPAATEQCDGVDNDCDGIIDPDSASDAPTWYADADGDGYGDLSVTTVSCEISEGSGWVDNTEDCDDSPGAGADISPAADERCDSIDNNCDGAIDEDSAVDAITWFFDLDRDGWGDDEAAVQACERPDGAVSIGGDCDDTTTDASPEATEVCDGIDNDCDGAKDEGDAADATVYYTDLDRDGFGDPAQSLSACTRPLGYTLDDSDCNDGSDAAWPGADELCDTIDNNCDGVIDEDSAVDAATWFFDLDGDGFGDPALSAVACALPEGYADNAEDCDDGSDQAAPGGIEVCDGLDNNCDGTTDEDSAVDALTWYEDGDGDGHGVVGLTAVACDVPQGYAGSTDDCDDADGAIYPGAIEICDTLDNDCDGFADDADPEGAADTVSWYVDGDGDGYGDRLGTADYFSCAQQPGYAGNNEDCDDGAATTNPGALEVCDDGVDNDCDGGANLCALSGDWGAADADLRFAGDAADDYAGYAVASLGDVDGDGDDDFAVGAYGATEGVAYLFLNTPVGDVGSADADATLRGELDSDFAGFALAGAGDVDGDGFDDMVVGAYGSDTSASNAGAAYLVLGGSLSGELSLASAAARFIGESKSDRAGWSVAGAGDVNSDGFADVLVGANGNDAAGSSAGRAYLVYGPVGGEVSLSAADARLDGVAAGDGAASAMDSAGDVDGDGYDDLLIGAYTMTSGGAIPGGAYLVAGPVTGDISLADADTTFVGEADGDRAGWAVAGAGDLDQDGLDDLLIGAYAADPGGVSAAGATYVLISPLWGEVSLVNADARITGESTNDYSGVSVVAAGDVDGDDSPDILIGGHGEDDGGSKAGAAWVISGPFMGDIPMADASVKITGAAAGDYVGWSVSAGDMDGNGTRDLLIGGYTAASAAGSAYLLLNYGL